MKEEHFFYTPDIAVRPELSAEESQHAVKVLRLKAGSELTCTDGQGALYKCRLADASPRGCTLEVLERVEPELLWDGSIELAVAPTKHFDRMEWLLEKATEIGVDRITFLNCHNSERRVVKMERAERIVVAAMKQSQKARMPQLEGMVDFDAFVHRPFAGDRFIAHCFDEASIPTPRIYLGDALRRGTPTQVLIGPEGDFSIPEIETALKVGFQGITLGRSRLRTETAALAAVHLMYIANQR